MWYKASSVINAISTCGNLSIPGVTPSCPKSGNNRHCLDDFPECEGKTKQCPQCLGVTNLNGSPYFLYFDYYLDGQIQDGRIKILNTTLRRLIEKYGVNESLMVAA
jgi:hypothetical protein